MPRPQTFPIKKLIGFTTEMLADIDEYRFSHRLKTEADAVRHLIELGLKAPKQPD